jgi:hypothetical protein
MVVGQVGAGEPADKYLGPMGGESGLDGAVVGYVPVDVAAARFLAPWPALRFYGRFHRAVLPGLAPAIRSPGPAG